MYVVLANEVADVDLGEFEKVGICDSKVIAVPNIDVTLGIKGMRTSALDRPEDCQNSMYLMFEAPWDGQAAEQHLLEDPFEAGLIYRRKDDPQARHYVELKYDTGIGSLRLWAYFLIDADDCTFGFIDEQETFTDLEYSWLWQEGYIRGIK